MPWKECNVIDERLQFIARLRDGELALAVRRLLLPGEDIDDLMDRILK